MNSRSLLTSLLLLFLCLIVSSSASARWHRMRYRPRCYARICLKCQFYVYSRGKRSLVDNVYEETPTSDEINVYDQKWTGGEIRFMKLMLKDGQNYKKETSKSDWKNSVFDTVGSVWENAKKDDGNDSPPARFIHKRSVNSHTERCRIILNTPCCKQLNQAATYIGYRVKKN